MPELAEVAYYASRWDEGQGNRIERVSLHPEARIFRQMDPVLLTSQLTGGTFHGRKNRGKRAFFEFSGGYWLELGLGMTGSLSVAPADYAPERHDHLCLYQKKRVLVFTDPRMFGRVLLHEGEEMMDELPPEIVSAEFTASYLEAALTRRGGSMLKPLLLDQAIFPGIGNWMADEVLWRSKMHPEMRVRDLERSELLSLRRSLRTVCRQAMEVIAPDWSDPPVSWLFRHRWRDGGNCPRHGCGVALLREPIGGRTTCWCPECQEPSS